MTKAKPTAKAPTAKAKSQAQSQAQAKAKTSSKDKDKDKAAPRKPVAKTPSASASSVKSAAKPAARPATKSGAQPAERATSPATSTGKPGSASLKTSQTPGKTTPSMTTRKPETGKPAAGASVPPKRPAVPGRAPLSRSDVAARLAARDGKKKEEEKDEKERLKKSPYSKRDLAPMRTALLAKRLQLVGAIDRLGNEALRADEPDTDSEDVADHGTDAFERNMTLGLMENEARTLQQIEEALEQMATGRYGVCTQCGTAIPLVRLEALPFATTCVPCQEKAERRM
jgi:RNA polymerase-binding protein DksA